MIGKRGKNTTGPFFSFPELLARVDLSGYVVSSGCVQHRARATQDGHSSAGAARLCSPILPPLLSLVPACFLLLCTPARPHGASVGRFTVVRVVAFVLWPRLLFRFIFAVIGGPLYFFPPSRWFAAGTVCPSLGSCSTAVALFLRRLVTQGGLWICPHAGVMRVCEHEPDAGFRPYRPLSLGCL